MYRSSPFRSTLNTGYIKLWTCVALDQCKSWTPFGHFCPYFHTPDTLLCPKDEFTFTFRRGLIWKIDNPSTTLSLAPGIFDNPYKGAESAGCQKQQHSQEYQKHKEHIRKQQNQSNFHMVLLLKLLIWIGCFPQDALNSPERSRQLRRIELKATL